MSASPTPVRASAFEWARTALLSANILWTTLCLGGFLPGTRVLMAVLTAALIAVHFADPARGARAHPAGWLLVPFLVYAAANLAWVTPVRWLGWFDWLNWAQAAAVFWIVLNGVEDPACKRFLCGFLIALGAAAAILAGYQHFVNPHWIMLGRKQAAQFIGRSSGPFGIPNSLGVFMALLIPPVGALVFGRGRPAALRAVCAAALVLLTAGFVLAVSRGAWLALAAALALRPILSPGRSLGRRIAAAVAVAAAAVAVVAILYLSFPMMHTRVNDMVKDAGERTRPIMWRGAWRIFEAHPIFGGGAGSFDALFEPYRPVGYRDQPYYAHCDYLNTLADYGVTGFLLLFGAVGVIAWRCASARGLAGAAFTGLLAFALHLLVDFHMKIPALAMIVATVAALVTAEAWPSGPEVPAPAGAGRRLAFAAAGAALVLTFAFAVPKYRAEETRRAAREKIDRMAIEGIDVTARKEGLSEIRAAFARAVVLDPVNAQAWSDRAYGDSLWALVEPGQTAELGVEVEREAARAVALCPVVAEFWIREATGLDMQRLWIEGGACMVRALQIAPARADVWYYQAYHLSLVSTETEPAIAAANLCLRLDPGFPLAQALRQRLGNRQ
jgi:O-antigen ligase